MDNKRLIVVMFLGMGLMAAWFIGVRLLGEYLGYDLTPPPPAEQAQGDAPGPPTTNASTTAPAAPATQPGQLRVLETGGPDGPGAVALGAAEPSAASLLLETTPRGAGIERIVLGQFKQTVKGAEPYTFQQPYPDAPDAGRALATHSVTINGQTIDLSNVSWRLDAEQTNPDQGTVTYSVEVGDESGPVARISKLFRLYPRTGAEGQPDPRGGYEVLVRQTITNLSGAAISYQTTINGPTTPPRELEYGYDRTIIAGYRGRNQTVNHEAWQVEGFEEEEARQLLSDPEYGPFLWAGASSIYFNAIVRPVPRAEAESLGAAAGDVPVAEFIQEVVAESVNPAVEDRDRRAVAVRFVTRPMTVGPGNSLELPFRAFFGPKERGLLSNAYYGAAAMRYDETLVSPFGCTWCVFQPVVNVLVWLLTGFHWLLRDWGLAIIVLVVVVRLLLHPITKRSQRSMMRMAKLGPEIEKIKKKYGDDKEAMTKAMQEFYREHGAAMLPLGCLPLLLQTPIWIALYSTLQAEFRLRHAPFLYGWTWIDDLARPDHLIDFGQSYTLWFLPPVSGLNLLPLLLAVVFYIQIKIQPQPQATTPEMQTQQTIMKWMMVLMFPLFLYSAPSGLNLYILTSTLIGIWESKRVRAQFKAEEEAAKLQQPPTVVKDKPPRTARGKDRRGGEPQEKEKAAVPLTGWRAKWAQLQENVQKHVAQAQKEAARKSNDRKR